VVWTLRGRMIESCSCHVMCPCWLPWDAIIMDRGWCDSAFLFRIDEGKSNRVVISRTTVAVAMDFPGPTSVTGTEPRASTSTKGRVRHSGGNSNRFSRESEAAG